MIESVQRAVVPALDAPATSGSTVENGNAFRGTLWEAFTGHSAPAGTAVAPATAPVPASSDTKLANDVTSAPRTPVPAPLTPTPVTRTVTPRVSRDGAETPPGPPDPVRSVSDAMQRVGLDPTKYNLRTGSLPITIPTGGSYEYPVLWADVAGETIGFWLPSAISSPGMIAANIGNMIGKPIYEIL